MNKKNFPAQDEMLQALKALADPQRLKIIGLLAQDEFSAEELSEMLALQPSTISHHLAKLVKAGLVNTRSVSYYIHYRLEPDALRRIGKALSDSENLALLAQGVDLQAYDRKVIRNFSNADGSLSSLPAQYKKFLAILRHVARDFEYDRVYTEKEVNAILGRYHEDFARLRRELVEQGMMIRDSYGTRYERVRPEDQVTPDIHLTSWGS